MPRKNTAGPAPAPVGRTLTMKAFLAEGERLFGPDRRLWRFRCPVCGHAACGEEYLAAGAPEGAVGFSCIGRWMDGARSAFGGSGPGPCDYAGGGLFGLNPVHVIGAGDFFEFAAPAEEAGASVEVGA